MENDLSAGNSLNEIAFFEQNVTQLWKRECFYCFEPENQT